VVETQEVDAEREDALKKLQESQARNHAEQAALQAQDKRRADEEAKLRAAEEAKRAEEESRKRAEEQAKQADEAPKADKAAKDERAPKKPHEPRPSAERSEDPHHKPAHKKHGSHRMQDDREDGG
jgi:translation initiation factor IF-2